MDGMKTVIIILMPTMLYVSHITVCVRIYVLHVNHINVSDSTDTVYTAFP